MVVPLLRAARRAPERWLHPVRHRRAIAMLRRRERPRLVLVMCYGNICRSPYAAARLSELLAPAGVRVESAGLYGPGRPSPREAVEAARSRGIDLSSHASRLVNTQLAAKADLIVVMEAFQARAVIRDFAADPRKVVFLGDLDPEPITTRRIPDPEAQPLAVFSEVYARIERCAAALASAVAAT